MFLDFQKLKKDQAVTRLTLENKHIFAYSFKKIDIINDVIILIAAILKIFFYHCFL